MIKSTSAMSFSRPYVERRTSKNTFYVHLNKLIDWCIIEQEIKFHYAPGRSATGQRSYSCLLLFKMLLVGIWNGGLSDRMEEEMANENLSVMRFLGLCLEDMVPDHSVLSRFRTSMSKSGAFDQLLDKINAQLEGYGVLVKSGEKVDASITRSARKPKGKATYQVVEDRKEDDREPSERQQEACEMKLVKTRQPGVDAQGRRTKKGGKLYYGYKKHLLTEDGGLVLSLHTTAANEHDSKSLKSLLDSSELPPKTRVYADKAYKSGEHDDLLRRKRLKNGIHFKAVRGRQLTEREKLFNRLVSKRRYTVERTFGSEVRWLGAGIAKYVGQLRTHGQHVLEAIAYNLKRFPQLIINKGTGIPLTIGG